MTDKQIIMKEITECGFYCSKDDTERLYIYEVIKNTDEEWLKENPEATLLIDEWLYDYTDYDDRKVYGTSRNLIDVCYASTCEVYKIEDTKYKIYGNSEQFLIEDKPTYKEQLKAKEQECEKWKKLAETHLAETINMQREIDQLKEELVISIQENEEGREINAELKAENEELKNFHINLVGVKECEIKELNKYKQALIEIKDYCNKYPQNSIGFKQQILQKISEVLDV